MRPGRGAYHPPPPSAKVENEALEAHVGRFLLGCKCPVIRGIVVQEQDRLVELPAAFFLQTFFSYTSKDE
jgi:hypothetical protein